MKIGYPCINNSVGCKSSRTFRLRNYSPENLKEKVKGNLRCLHKTLLFNIKNNILFFRITSDLVPFASHNVCSYNWQKHFREDFKRIGELIKENKIRISMHPDQFVILNAKKEKIRINSIKELRYHSQILDLMNLDQRAKIQIHVGGVYGDKKASMERFIKVYATLNNEIKRRLVIENDEKSYSASDCLYISSITGIPVLFDFFHHRINNLDEDKGELIKKIVSTWRKKDGPAMMDYSSQLHGERSGRHANQIDLNDFSEFLKILGDIDADIMLEIKDKEKSAIKAAKLLKNNG